MYSGVQRCTAMYSGLDFTWFTSAVQPFNDYYMDAAMGTTLLLSRYQVYSYLITRRRANSLVT